MKCRKCNQPISSDATQRISLDGWAEHIGAGSSAPYGSQLGCPEPKQNEEADMSTGDDKQRAHFWGVMCDEVDIRIDNYRIGTIANGKKQVWFAIRDGQTCPDGPTFDAKQQAIDYAIAEVTA